METNHILYNNCMYHKLQTEQICSMIRNQERVVRCVRLLDVNADQAAYIYYKRDCLYFELHRRAFINCMIQMTSYHKVKNWLKYVTPEKRCGCCRPEYYEFKYDCERIDCEELPPSDLISAIISTGALSGGRCFFKKQLDDGEPEGASGLNRPSSLTESATQEAKAGNSTDETELPESLTDTDTYDYPAAQSKISKIFKNQKGSPSSTSNYSKTEGRYLLHISKVELVAAGSSSNDTMARSNLGAVRRATNESLPKSSKGKKSTKQRSPRSIIAFKDRNIGNVSCSYSLLRDDDSAGPENSNKSTDSKIPISHWHFSTRGDDFGPKKKPF